MRERHAEPPEVVECVGVGEWPGNNFPTPH